LGRGRRNEEGWGEGKVEWRGEGEWGKEEWRGGCARAGYLT